MAGEWYRTRDFFYDGKPTTISFRNMHGSAVIKEITILNNELGFKILLWPSDCFIEILESILRKHSYSCSIRISSEGDLDKLMALFDEINATQFPLTLRAEIRNIFSYIQAVKTLKGSCPIPFTHITQLIPEVKEDSDFDKTVREIVTFKYRRGWTGTPEMRKREERRKLNKAAKLFAEGLSLNKPAQGRLPLSLAMEIHHLELFKLMLVYGADPFMRIDGCFESSAEKIARWEMGEDGKILREFKRIINLACSKPQKALDPNKKVETTHIRLMKHCGIPKGTEFPVTIHTEFNFPNHTKIHSFLQSSDFALPLNQSSLPVFLQDVFNLFFHAFPMHAPAYDAFRTIFGKNKYYEMIYNKDELIGFNSFEICNPKKHPKLLILHGMYSFIKKEYRGYRLGSLLAFRLGFTFQQLLPHKHVGIFFFAIHNNSFRIAEDFEPYPKYRTIIKDDLVEGIISDVSPEEKLIKDDEGVARYVPDDTQVVGGINIDSPDINEEFFYKFLQDLESKSVERRSSPVLFFANRKNFDILSEAVSTIPIALDKHILQLSAGVGLWKEVKNEFKKEVRPVRALLRRSRL